MSEHDYQEILRDLPRRQKVWAAIANLDYGLSGLEYVLRTCRESGYSWAELDRIARYEVVPGTSSVLEYFDQFYDDDWLFERIPRLVRRRHHALMFKLHLINMLSVVEEYWREVEWRFKGCEGSVDPKASLRLRYCQRLKKMSDEYLAAAHSDQIAWLDAWRQAYETRSVIMAEARSHKPIEPVIILTSGVPGFVSDVLTFIKWWKRRRNPPRAFIEEEKGIVGVNDKSIFITWPGGHYRTVEWDAVQSIAIQINERGPFNEDFRLRLIAGEADFNTGEGICSWPYGATGETQAMKEIFRRFPDIDYETLLKAYGSTEKADFVCWER